MEEAFIEAAELAQAQQTDNGIEKARKDAISSEDLAPHQFTRYDCEDCGEDLPLFRMQKGRQKCVSCQANNEKGRKWSERAL